MKIKIHEVSYNIGDGFFPIPRGFHYEGKFSLTGHLLSTKGRRAAWWAAGENWRPHLSAARYQPSLHCEVEGTIQEISAQTGLLDEPDPQPDELFSCIRGWGQPRNTLIYIRAKTISSDRPLRKQLIEKLSIESPSFRQGNLEISLVHTESVDLSIVKYFYPSFPETGYFLPKFLLNHEIFCPIIIPFDMRRLLFSPYRPIKIVSPNHPLNPISLERDCWWLLSHPIPVEYDID